MRRTMSSEHRAAATTTGSTLPLEEGTQMTFVSQRVFVDSITFVSVYFYQVEHLVALHVQLLAMKRVMAAEC